MKTKPSPINIAPFVDVLLVLFVILVVAARFDGPGKDEISRLNMLIQDQKNKIALLSTKKPVIAALPTTKIIDRVVAASAVVKTEIKVVEDTTKIGTLNDRVAELEEQLAKARSAVAKLDSPGGRSANIVFGVEGRVSVNGVDVDEDFVYKMVKSVRPDINIGWKGRGHEAADRFQEFAGSIGYGK